MLSIYANLITFLIVSSFFVLFISQKKKFFLDIKDKQHKKFVTKTKNYSLLNIFPYFVLGFIGMIIFRNIGDQIFLTENTQIIWQNLVLTIKDSAKIFLSMAMAAVGLSTNLKDLRSMGYKPFIVGFIAMVTVGLVSIISMKIFTELFL